MRKPWIFISALLLVAPRQPLWCADEKTTASTTLQEITRDAEERLRQWDAEDLQEQEWEAKYWWLGFIELAASIALGHSLRIHSAGFTSKSGLTIQKVGDSDPVISVQ
jgi:hypothetical protein